MNPQDLPDDDSDSSARGFQVAVWLMLGVLAAVASVSVFAWASRCWPWK
ncbi:hypothetical protein [uncultured Pseudacidovorax sp.]|nr:hypothetical protein [uncultured Pseudacidovorax sp.]